MADTNTVRSPAILFAGDLMPVRPVALPSDWCGSQVIANLECAIAVAVGRRAKAHNIVLPPSAADHLAAANVAALSVANNHTLDAGSEGLRETLALLRDRVSAQVYGTIETPLAELDFGGGRCAVVGCLERCRARGRRLFPEEHVLGLIRDLSSHYTAVFVTPHWGKEGEFASYPSPRQVRLAQRWIEAGAAGIFGHHPHVLHGRNVFAGRPVYYSLGNLWFPHEESREYPASRVGLAVQVEMIAGTVEHSEHFFIANDGGIDSHPASEQQLQKCLNEMSHALEGHRWSTIRWARSVGSVYIDKSMRSWRKRFSSSNGWKSRGLFLLWLMMPSTMLLWLGKSFPLEASGMNGCEIGAIAQNMTAGSPPRRSSLPVTERRSPNA